MNAIDGNEGPTTARPAASRSRRVLWFAFIVAFIGLPVLYYGYWAYRLHKGGRELYSDLHVAVLDGDVGRVRELLDKGARADPRSAYGYTPLALATGKNDEIVRLLVSHGADVNAKTPLGYRPLVGAVYGDSLSQVRLLVEKGAEVDFHFLWRNTPLHVAALRASPEVTEYLLQHGADVNRLNDQGLTPLDMATSQERPDVADVLRRYGGKTAAEMPGTSKPDSAGAGQDKSRTQPTTGN